MRIREGDRDLSEPKTLKVVLPARLHLQLHSLKILTGKNISATVEEALSAFFADSNIAKQTDDLLHDQP